MQAVLENAAEFLEEINPKELMNAIDPPVGVTTCMYCGSKNIERAAIYQVEVLSHKSHTHKVFGLCLEHMGIFHREVHPLLDNTLSYVQDRIIYTQCRN